MLPTQEGKQMNDTVLALLSALVVYGLASFALPLSGPDAADDDSTIQVEDRVDLPSSDDFNDRNG
jgi:hypothetical protein